MVLIPVFISYLTVDYDRSTFTLAQASHPDPSVPQRLIPIIPPSNSSSNSSATPSGSGIGIGAIAGIAAGGLLILLILLLTYILIRRRRRRNRDREVAEAATVAAPVTPDADPAKALGWKAELDAHETRFLGHEVPAEEEKEKIGGEMAVGPVGGTEELDSKERYRGGVWRSDDHVYEMSADPVVRELEGSERRAELEGEDGERRRVKGGGSEGIGGGVRRKAVKAGDSRRIRKG